MRLDPKIMDAWLRDEIPRQTLLDHLHEVGASLGRQDIAARQEHDAAMEADLNHCGEYVTLIDPDGYL